MAMFSSSAKSEDECAEVVSNGEGAVEIQRRRSEQLTTIHVHNGHALVRAPFHHGKKVKGELPRKTKASDGDRTN
jgi:hypothetical protein